MRLETSEARNVAQAEQALFDIPILSSQQTLAQIDKLTTADVNKVRTPTRPIPHNNLSVLALHRMLYNNLLSFTWLD